MADGPGKYDDLATYVRTEARAKVAIVIVLGGNRGSGFSVQLESEQIALSKLPGVLRAVADQLEADLRPRVVEPPS